MVDSAKVSEFMGLTGTDAAFATSFLEQHGWEVNLAVDTFLATDIPEEPAIRKPLPARSDQLVEHDPRFMIMRQPKAKNPWQDHTLANMFRPPTEICFRGSFDELLRQASHEHKWVMVNVQENTEFASHRLNRDTWQNAQLKRLLAQHFVFWQVLADDVHGHSFVTLYHAAKLPLIAIIDPRTRQEMSRWTGFVEPQQLVTLLQDFLEDNDISSNVAPTRQAQEGKHEPRKKVKTVQELTDDEQLALALQASADDWGGGEISLPASETKDAAMTTSSSSTSSQSQTAPPSSQPSSSAVTAPQKQQQPLAQQFDEPEPPAGPQVTQVQLRLPSGNKITRRFRFENKVEDIYRFVASLLPPTGHSDFVLITSFPKKKLQDRTATVQEARLQNSSLIVELT